VIDQEDGRLRLNGQKWLLKLTGSLADNRLEGKKLKRGLKYG